MPRSTDRFLATAIVCSVGIHIAGMLMPYILDFMLEEPHRQTTAPPAKYAPMLPRDKTAVWLTSPRKKEVPPPPPPILAPEEAIVTPATKEPQVYDAAQLTESPEPVGEVQLPNFPGATSSGGRAELILLISPQGEVLDISVADATMAPRALTSTLEAFRTTHFRPGTVNGNPVVSRIRIVVSLQNEH